MPGRVDVCLSPQGGVVELRIVPGEEGFAEKDLFQFAGRLGPLVRALDESLREFPGLRERQRVVQPVRERSGAA